MDEAKKLSTSLLLNPILQGRAEVAVVQFIDVIPILENERQ